MLNVHTISHVLLTEIDYSDKSGQIFDLTKTQKTTKKHQNHYKNTHFSFLCRRKNCILSAYAGVRSFHSSCNFDTKKRLVFRQAYLLFNCHYLSSKQVEEHLSQETLRNACAFHTFFLGVSQVPEPRKVWCHKWSVGHSSWLCAAFFYSTAFNSSLELITDLEDLERQFNSINIACWCRLLISLLRWLWLLISLLLLCRLLNLLGLLSLLN